ncbi:Uncharacterized protein Adt_27179 [Abeliophyllum distichum]|uniref:DUF6570 domain-containing protein n=1 Tax=Abeliophyllum distichum TaxID=126358 RepID=A0ABD1RTR6_9LAMI
MPKSSDVFATEGLIIRSRSAIRRRRTSFNSLAMPFNNIPRTTPFGPLYQTRVNTKRRATRSRRTLFSSFIIPIEREMHVESLHSPINHNERRRARQVIDTARRRKARAARTIEQRANDLAIDNARRKRFCEGQTSEQRSKVRASNTTRKQRSRYRESQRGLNPLKFSAQNIMDPGVVPIELSRLTNLEQILIARAHPMMSVYRVKGQQYKYSGNVINFAQDVNSIADVLPFKPADLSAILIVNRTGAHAIKQFRVRREYVRQALVWLKQNHLYYRDITIDEISLETLPEDGIPEDIPHVHEDNAHLNENQSIDVVEDDIEGPPEIVNQNVHIDDFHAAGTIFIGPQPNQQACIQRALHVADVDHTIAHMHLSNEVIDEFSTPGYISMVFPTLFPYGNADFRQARPRKLNPSEYFQYLMKYLDGRFAKDSRFRYFAWNSISRWRALSLGDVYVKKNPADAELSIQDIQNMVASGDT